VIVLRRRRLHACAAVLALAVTTLSLIFSTRVAAGSDAYGYVSGNRAGLVLRKRARSLVEPQEVEALRALAGAANASARLD